MVSFRILFFLLIISTSVFSQKYCKIKSSVGDTVKIKVNGIKYTITKSYKKVKIHFPGFDTIVFFHRNGIEEGPVTCNFKPDSLYNITHGCCTSLDIIPANRFKADSLSFWSSYNGKDEDKYFYEIQKVLLDYPHFIFKTKNTEPGDTIYVWNADAACMPRIGLASGPGCDYGTPNKCYYWTNMNFLTFFRSKNKYKLSVDKHICEDDGNEDAPFPESNTEVLGTLFVRLFDNKTYLVTYDAKTKKIKIEYSK